MYFPLPELVHSRIAQVYSQSDVPSEAPSLLSIAPELRNQIYEYLLVDCQPITISYGDEESPGKTTYSAGSPAIIHTCRQIYHEAVGIFYGMNEFRFNFEIDFGKDEPKTNSPLETFSVWMQGIGSCLSGLRTVLINMDDPDILCRYRQAGGSDQSLIQSTKSNLAILPLLDVLWSEMARNMSIKFESTSSDSESDDSGPNGKLLTKALYELGKKDTLSLKRTRRLLQELYIHPAGNRGIIGYRSTDYDNNSNSVRREFRLSEKTQEYYVVPLLTPLTLLHLPASVIRAIARLALTGHEVTHNFDTGVSHGHEFGLLNVNTQLRKIVRPSFLSETRFTLVLGPDTLQHHKATWKGLDRRMAETLVPCAFLLKPRLEHCTPAAAVQEYHNVPTVVLQFPDAEHIQISAWHLLKVTSTLPNRTRIIVRICGHGGILHDTTLGDTRKYALALMYHVKDRQWPHDSEHDVEAELNYQCLPVRVILKSNRTTRYTTAGMVWAEDTVDITLLHKMVEETWPIKWKPDGQKNWNAVVQHRADWHDRTTDGLIKRLRHFCL